MRRRLAGVAVAVLVATSAACRDDGGGTEPTIAEAPPTSLHVVPGAAGTTCQADDPCGSIPAAVAVAPPGSTIVLAPGEYRDSTIGGDDVPSSGGVVITGSEAGEVVLNGTTSVRAHLLTFQGVTIRGTFRTEADDRVLELVLRDVVVENGTVLLNGVRDARVVDSEFRDGLNRDALNVKDGSVRVEISGNAFHDYRHDPSAPDADLHVDCLQLFAAQEIRVVGNEFRNCAQRAMLVQVAGFSDTRDIVAENNVFGGCTAGDACQTANVPFQATGRFTAEAIGSAEEGVTGEDYRIVNNLVDGYAFIEDLPGLVFANNVIGRYFHTDPDKVLCGSDAVRNNLVAEFGRCIALAASDRLGQPSENDLGFADVGLAPATDRLGRSACGPRDVGPDEQGCAP